MNKTPTKIYIAGKISEDRGYKTKFDMAEMELKTKGYTVINPTCLPQDLPYDDYFPINCAMISVCDAIYMLDNWATSFGAMLEHAYAMGAGKKIIYELGRKIPKDKGDTK